MENKICTNPECDSRSLPATSEYFRERNGKLLARCRECERKYKNSWNNKNKDKVNSYHRKYEKDNRSKITENRRIRRNNDVKTKIRSNCMVRIDGALVHKERLNTYSELIGCDWDFLVEYIESKFEVWMSWENYGRWHPEEKRWQIDHILPCSSFRLNEESEQLACFNFKNLRPLCATENMSRNDS